METANRVQTVLRLPQEIMLRAKYKAKQQGKSLNSYFEDVITEAVRPEIPKLPKDFKIDPVIESLSGIFPAPTKEQLEADDRLAYIWNKGGLL